MIFTAVALLAAADLHAYCALLQDTNFVIVAAYSYLVLTTPLYRVRFQAVSKEQFPAA